MNPSYVHTCAVERLASVEFEHGLDEDEIDDETMMSEWHANPVTPDLEGR